MVGRLLAFWSHVHPKIKAVAYVALATGFVTLLNGLANLYPNAWYGPLIAVIAASVAGWATPAKKP